MKRAGLVTLVTLLIITAAGLAAQQPPEPAYDLQAVVNRTLEANPQLKAAQQDVALAKAKLAEAKGYKLPQLKGQIGRLQLDEDPSFNVQGFGTMYFGDAQNNFSNVLLELPLYTSGMLEDMIRAARAGVDASLHGYACTRQELAAEAAVGYYQALTAREMIGVMEQQHTTLEEAVRVATAFYKQGIVAKLDVMRSQAALASADAMLSKANNGYGVAIANLRRLMSLPENAPVSLEAVNLEPKLPKTFDEALKVALDNRPEVQQLKAYQVAARAQAAAAEAQMRPHVGLQSQWDFKRATTYPNYGDWTVAVVLQQNLFDGGISRAQRNQAKAQYKQVTSQLQALKEGITLQVKKALLDLESAKERLAAAEKGLTAAKEAYRLAKLGYENQVSTMLDVLSAQTALTGAGVQRAVANFDVQVARTQVLLACGLLPEGLFKPAQAEQAKQ